MEPSEQQKMIEEYLEWMKSEEGKEAIEDLVRLRQ